jgi:hypothetical protein
VVVTLRIARNQIASQETLASRQREQLERDLKKDLFDRRFRIFTDTAEFMRPILSSPSAFTPQSDEHRRFQETMQTAGMLFGADVREYLEDVEATAVGLSASRQRMSADPGDIGASREYSDRFQHLSDLWSKRPDVFRGDLALG